MDCQIGKLSIFQKKIGLSTQFVVFLCYCIQTDILSKIKHNKKYKEKNKSAVQLNQLKQNIKRDKRKETDPEKAEKVRLENNKRKAAQRKREKEINKENISAAENSDSDMASKAKSRKQEKTGARNQNEIFPCAPHECANSFLQDHILHIYWFSSIFHKLSFKYAYDINNF